MNNDAWKNKEIASRGWKIYEDRLKNDLEPENIGKFLVIDVESGDYEISDDEMEAVDRAMERHANGMLYLMRIGFRTMGKMGAGLRELKS